MKLAAACSVFETHIGAEEMGSRGGEGEEGRNGSGDGDGDGDGYGYGHGQAAQGRVGAGAPGGPLIMSGYTSPLISFSHFRTSSLNLLASLQSHLTTTTPNFSSSSSLQIPDDDSDLLVDDLKILTDQQLVELAMTEAFQLKHQRDGGTGASGPLAIVPYNPESASVDVRVCHGGTVGGLRDVEGFEGARVVAALENVQQGVAVAEVAPLACAELSVEDMLQAEGNGSEKEVQNRVSENKLALLSVEGGQHPYAEEEKMGKYISKVNGKGSQSDPPSAGELQQKKKRGRPYDIFARGSELEVDTRQEEAIARFKQQREAAKKSCALHSLKAKEENEGVSTSSGKLQNLRALKFFTSFLPPAKAILSKKKARVINPTEVVLCIEFYGNMKKKTVTQEFLVLGSQPLTALRDQLYCLTDELAQRAGVKVPSGYFLIEDVFYNDMRDPSATDYSAPILNWVKHEGEAKQKWKSLGSSAVRKRLKVGLAISDLESKENLPDFKQADMNRTCFVDLVCRLGADYLYCHQGDCKHIFVIRDLRMVHPSDAQNVSAYPLLRFPPALKHRKCSICSIYRAKKVTLEDKLAPDSPCFFCENCYYLLHYSKDGSLLYDDFKVYDYFHE